MKKCSSVPKGAPDILKSHRNFDDNANGFSSRSRPPKGVSVPKVRPQKPFRYRVGIREDEMTFIEISIHRNFVSAAETKFRYRNCISVSKFRLRRDHFRYRMQKFGTEMAFRYRNFVSKKHRNQFATELSIGGDRFKLALKNAQGF